MLGIPALYKVSDNVSFASLLVADSVIFARMFQSHAMDNPSQTPTASPLVWGIFEGQTKVLFPDSIVSVDIKKEWNLPNYPMEKGAFQTYNKVAMPFDVRVRMTLSGDEYKQLQFLDALDKLAGSVKTYDVITKGAAYLNANIKHYDMRRTAQNGFGMLTVDVLLQEVRNSVLPAFSNVKTASAATPQKTRTNAIPASVKAAYQ